MITGDTIPKVKYLQTLAGRNLSYASAAAFTADGWAITWYDTTNTALASQPTYTVTDMGSGRHMIAFTVPSGYATAKFTIPSQYQDPGTFSTQGLAYDESTLAGLLQTSQGVVGVRSAADSDLGDVVSGDSWTSGSLTVPLGRISPWGYTDLTGFGTPVAGFKKDPSTSPVTAGITAAIVNAAAMTVSVSWDTFPTAMKLAYTSSDLSQVWFCDFQATHTASGRVVTLYRFKLNVVWQRDSSA